jgi:DNA-binding transcriptional regulator YiaG
MTNTNTTETTNALNQVPVSTATAVALVATFSEAAASVAKAKGNKAKAKGNKAKSHRIKSVELDEAPAPTGNAVDTMRKAFGFTVVELAHVMGMSHPAAYRWINAGEERILADANQRMRLVAMVDFAKRMSALKCKTLGDEIVELHNAKGKLAAQQRLLNAVVVL